MRFLLCVLSAFSAFGLLAPLQAHAAKKSAATASPAVAAAQRYAEAVANGDRVAAGRLDFACQYEMVAAKPLTAFPPDRDPIYGRCWDRLVKAHETAVEQRDLGVNVIWPGKGSLVFYPEDLTEYAPSFFVMDRLGLSPPGGGLRIEPAGSASIPAASFHARPGSPLVEAPAAAVKLAVTYKDPLTSPVTYGPSEDNVTRKAKRVRQALKGVTVRIVVLSGLRKVGFPGDTAVLNLPMTGPDGSAVPFVTERSAYVHDTRVWWKASDVAGPLTAAVGRVAQFPERLDRVAMLNRVLLIDPMQNAALSALSRELYDALLNAAAAEHKAPLGDPVLAVRFNEVYWNAVSQTTRMEIAEPSYVAQRGALNPADILFRMLPAMEKRARLTPEDLENRLRLGIAQRWNREHENAIETHEQLVKAVQGDRPAVRTRALVELAWSRIAKVEWSRRLEDPGTPIAYGEAEEALKLAETPLDKFMADYAMAYSLQFMPARDNKKMLSLLTDARKWYQQVPGATPDSWRVLMDVDTLKGVIGSDPSFQPLLASP